MLQCQSFYRGPANVPVVDYLAISIESFGDDVRAREIYLREWNAQHKRTLDEIYIL